MDHVTPQTSLFGPLLAADSPFVLGRLAQSLDGFIATRSGESHWISGPEDIAHTHRLRALFDAVVVGAGTIRADDPQLTTRLVEGPSPVRVVLDPERRLGAGYRVFRDGPPTLLLCAPESGLVAPRWCRWRAVRLASIFLRCSPPWRRAGCGGSSSRVGG